MKTKLLKKIRKRYSWIFTEEFLIVRDLKTGNYTARYSLKPLRRYIIVFMSDMASTFGFFYTFIVWKNKKDQIRFNNTVKECLSNLTNIKGKA